MVLHDSASKIVEIVCVRIAEPVVYIHRNGNGTIAQTDGILEWDFDAEMVWVELGELFVLAYAEMNAQRHQIAFIIKPFAVDFHVMIAATKRFGPKHFRLRWIVEETSLVVGFVEAKGET